MQTTVADYVAVPVRTAAILTNAYVAGTVIGLPASSSLGIAGTAPDVSYYNFLALEIDFTVGSLTDAQIKIEFSDDNTSYYQLSKGAYAAGVITQVQSVEKIATTGLYYINVNAEYFNGGGFKTKFIKVSAIGTGTVTSSSMKVTAVVGCV